MRRSAFEGGRGRSKLGVCLAGKDVSAEAEGGLSRFVWEAEGGEGG